MTFGGPQPQEHRVQAIGRHPCRAAFGCVQWPLSQIDVPPLRLHPSLELLDRVADAVEHDEELGEQGFEAGAVGVVAMDRVDERGLVLFRSARGRADR
jgi:hypothetical protein